ENVSGSHVQVGDPVDGVCSRRYSERVRTNEEPGRGVYQGADKSGTGDDRRIRRYVRQRHTALPGLKHVRAASPSPARYGDDCGLSMSDVLMSISDLSVRWTGHRSATR